VPIALRDTGSYCSPEIYSNLINSIQKDQVFECEEAGAVVTGTHVSWFRRNQATDVMLDNNF
jgi:hypothetical protein